MTQLRYALIAACLLAGCTTDPSSHGVIRPSVVAPGLMRCGQPTPEGFVYLRSLGYSNDVMLATGIDKGAKEAGFNVVYLPITMCQQLEGGPSVRTVGKAVAWMLQPGTIVHCVHGQDRTGEIVGVYRVWVFHWTPQRAYYEMKVHGFHPILKGLYDSYWGCVK